MFKGKFLFGMVVAFVSPIVLSGEDVCKRIEGVKEYYSGEGYTRYANDAFSSESKNLVIGYVFHDYNGCELMKKMLPMFSGDFDCRSDFHSSELVSGKKVDILRGDGYSCIAIAIFGFES